MYDSPLHPCSAPSRVASLPADRSTRDPVSLQERLDLVVERHFDPRWGSPFWLARARELRIDGRRELRTLADLDRLGIFAEHTLRDRSVWEFVPRSCLLNAHGLVVVDSGGTLGGPSRTVFTHDEFHAAFVAPFLASVGMNGAVPREAVWLYIGPSGPHAIGKAAREVCRAMGSPDPFAVDLDPRWYKAQLPGSLDRRRYLRHVLDQALDVLRREPVQILFSTPPIVAELAKHIGASTRNQILAVHLGGLAASHREAEVMSESFPNAALLDGFGNSLLGLCPEVIHTGPDAPVYYPHGWRLHLRLVSECEPDRPAVEREVPYGERGRLLATRLDESCLIVNLFERDTALRSSPPPNGAAFGFFSDGLGAPRPLASVGQERIGIY